MAMRASSRGHSTRRSCSPDARAGPPGEGSPRRRRCNPRAVDIDVEVWVRARPNTKTEQAWDRQNRHAANGSHNAVRMYSRAHNGGVTIMNPLAANPAATYRSFAFDRCSWSVPPTIAPSKTGAPYVEQSEFYAPMQRLVAHVMNGINVTVIAYGAAGTGKTYTMFGNGRPPQVMAEDRGIVPRVAFDLLKQALKYNGTHKFRYVKMDIAAVGVVKGDAYDLMREYVPQAAPGHKPENITPVHVTTPTPMSGFNGGYDEKIVHMPELTWRGVFSQDDIDHALKVCAGRRSAQGHCIVLLRVTKQHGASPHGVVGPRNAAVGAHEADPVRTSTSVFTLADLAGGEDLRRSGAAGGDAAGMDDMPGRRAASPSPRCTSVHRQAASAEAVHNNRSLSTLRAVFERLANPSKPNVHASPSRFLVDTTQLAPPFRESVLTKILANSLGGTARTVLISHVSCHPNAYQETYNTLKFSEVVKSVICTVTHSVPDPPCDDRAQELKRALEDPWMSGTQGNTLRNLLNDELDELSTYDARLQAIAEENRAMQGNRKIQQDVVNKYNTITARTNREATNVDAELEEAQGTMKRLMDRLHMIEAKAGRLNHREVIGDVSIENRERAQKFEHEKAVLNGQLEKAARDKMMLQDLRRSLMSRLSGMTLDTPLDPLLDDDALQASPEAPSVAGGLATPVAQQRVDTGAGVGTDPKEISPPRARDGSGSPGTAPVSPGLPPIQSIDRHDVSGGVDASALGVGDGVTPLTQHVNPHSTQHRSPRRNPHSPPVMAVLAQQQMGMPPPPPPPPAAIPPYLSPVPREISSPTNHAGHPHYGGLGPAESSYGADYLEEPLELGNIEPAAYGAPRAPPAPPVVVDRAPAHPRAHPQDTERTWLNALETLSARVDTVVREDDRREARHLSAATREMARGHPTFTGLLSAVEEKLQRIANPQPPGGPGVGANGIAGGLSTSTPDAGRRRESNTSNEAHSSPKGATRVSFVEVLEAPGEEQVHSHSQPLASNAGADAFDTDVAELKKELSGAALRVGTLLEQLTQSEAECGKYLKKIKSLEGRIGELKQNCDALVGSILQARKYDLTPPAAQALQAGLAEVDYKEFPAAKTAQATRGVAYTAAVQSLLQPEEYDDESTHVTTLQRALRDLAKADGLLSVCPNSIKTHLSEIGGALALVDLQGDLKGQLAVIRHRFTQLRRDAGSMTDPAVTLLTPSGAPGTAATNTHAIASPGGASFALGGGAAAEGVLVGVASPATAVSDLRDVAGSIRRGGVGHAGVVALAEAITAAADLALRVRRDDNAGRKIADLAGKFTECGAREAAALAQEAGRRLALGDGIGSAAALHAASAAAAADVNLTAPVDTRAAASHPTRLASLLNELADLQFAFTRGDAVSTARVKHVRDKACALSDLAPGAAETAALALVGAITQRGSTAAAAMAASAARRFPVMAGFLRQVVKALEGDQIQAAVDAGRRGAEALYHTRQAVVEASEASRLLRMRMEGVQVVEALARAEQAIRDAARAHGVSPAGTALESAASAFHTAYLHAKKREFEASSTAAESGLEGVAKVASTGVRAACTYAKKLATWCAEVRGKAVSVNSIMAVQGGESSPEALALAENAMAMANEASASADASHPSALVTAGLELAAKQLTAAADHFYHGSTGTAAGEVIGSAGSTAWNAWEAHTAVAKAAGRAKDASDAIAVYDHPGSRHALRDAIGHIYNAEPNVPCPTVSADLKALAARLQALVESGCSPENAAEAMRVQKDLAGYAGEAGGDEIAARHIAERLNELLRGMVSKQPPEIVTAIKSTMTAAVDLADGPSLGEAAGLGVKEALEYMVGTQDASGLQDVITNVERLAAAPGVLGEGMQHLAAGLGSGAVSVEDALAAAQRALDTNTALKSAAKQLLGIATAPAANGAAEDGEEDHLDATAITVVGGELSLIAGALDGGSKDLVLRISHELLTNAAGVRRVAVKAMAKELLCLAGIDYDSDNDVPSDKRALLRFIKDVSVLFDAAGIAQNSPVAPLRAGGPGAVATPADERRIGTLELLEEKAKEGAAAALDDGGAVEHIVFYNGMRSLLAAYRHALLRPGTGYGAGAADGATTMSHVTMSLAATQLLDGDAVGVEAIAGLGPRGVTAERLRECLGGVLRKHDQVADGEVLSRKDLRDAAALARAFAEEADERVRPIAESLTDGANTGTLEFDVPAVRDFVNATGLFGAARGGVAGHGAPPEGLAPSHRLLQTLQALLAKHVEGTAAVKDVNTASDAAQPVAAAHPVLAADAEKLREIAVAGDVAALTTPFLEGMVADTQRVVMKEKESALAGTRLAGALKDLVAQRRNGEALDERTVRTAAALAGDAAAMAPTLQPVADALSTGVSDGGASLTADVLALLFARVEEVVQPATTLAAQALAAAARLTHALKTMLQSKTLRTLRLPEIQQGGALARVVAADAPALQHIPKTLASAERAPAPGEALSFDGILCMYVDAEAHEARARFENALAAFQQKQRDGDATLDDLRSVAALARDAAAKDPSLSSIAEQLTAAEKAGDLNIDLTKGMQAVASATTAAGTDATGGSRLTNALRALRERKARGELTLDDVRRAAALARERAKDDHQVQHIAEELSRMEEAGDANAITADALTALAAAAEGAADTRALIDALTALVEKQRAGDLTIDDIRVAEVLAKEVAAKDPSLQHVANALLAALRSGGVVSSDALQAMLNDANAAAADASTASPRASRVADMLRKLMAKQMAGTLTADDIRNAAALARDAAVEDPSVRALAAELSAAEAAGGLVTAAQLQAMAGAADDAAAEATGERPSANRLANALQRLKEKRGAGTLGLDDVRRAARLAREAAEKNPALLAVAEELEAAERAGDVGSLTEDAIDALLRSMTAAPPEDGGLTELLRDIARKAAEGTLLDEDLARAAAVARDAAAADPSLRGVADELAAAARAGAANVTTSQLNALAGTTAGVRLAKKMRHLLRQQEETGSIAADDIRKAAALARDAAARDPALRGLADALTAAAGGEALSPDALRALTADAEARSVEGALRDLLRKAHAGELSADDIARAAARAREAAALDPDNHALQAIADALARAAGAEDAVAALSADAVDDLLARAEAARGEGPRASTSRLTAALQNLLRKKELNAVSLDDVRRAAAAAREAAARDPAFQDLADRLTAAERAGATDVPGVSEGLVQSIVADAKAAAAEDARAAAEPKAVATKKKLSEALKEIMAAHAAGDAPSIDDIRKAVALARAAAAENPDDPTVQAALEKLLAAEANGGALTEEDAAALAGIADAVDATAAEEATAAAVKQTKQKLSEKLRALMRAHNAGLPASAEEIREAVALARELAALDPEDAAAGGLLRHLEAAAERGDLSGAAGAIDAALPGLGDDAAAAGVATASSVLLPSLTQLSVMLHGLTADAQPLKPKPGRKSTETDHEGDAPAATDGADDPAPKLARLLQQATEDHAELEEGVLRVVRGFLEGEMAQAVTTKAVEVTIDETPAAGAADEVAKKAALGLIDRLKNGDADAVAEAQEAMLRLRSNSVNLGHLADEAEKRLAAGDLEGLAAILQSATAAKNYAPSPPVAFPAHAPRLPALLAVLEDLRAKAKRGLALNDTYLSSIQEHALIAGGFGPGGAEAACGFLDDVTADAHGAAAATAAAKRLGMEELTAASLCLKDGDAPSAAAACAKVATAYQSLRTCVAAVMDAQHKATVATRDTAAAELLQPTNACLAQAATKFSLLLSEGGEAKAALAGLCETAKALASAEGVGLQGVVKEASEVGMCGAAGVARACSGLAKTIGEISQALCSAFCDKAAVGAQVGWLQRECGALQHGLGDAAIIAIALQYVTRGLTNIDLESDAAGAECSRLASRLASAVSAQDNAAKARVVCEQAAAEFLKGNVDGGLGILDDAITVAKTLKTFDNSVALDLEDAHAAGRGTPSVILAAMATDVAKRLSALAGEPTPEHRAACVIASRLRELRDVAASAEQIAMLDTTLHDASIIGGLAPSRAETAAQALADCVGRTVDEALKLNKKKKKKKIDPLKVADIRADVLKTATEHAKAPGAPGAAMKAIATALEEGALNNSRGELSEVEDVLAMVEGAVAAVARLRGLANDMRRADARAAATGGAVAAEDMSLWSGMCLASVGALPGDAGKPVVEFAERLADAANRIGKGQAVPLGGLKDTACELAGLAATTTPLDASEFRDAELLALAEQAKKSADELDAEGSTDAAADLRDAAKSLELAVSTATITSKTLAAVSRAATATGPLLRLETLSRRLADAVHAAQPDLLALGRLTEDITTASTQHPRIRGALAGLAAHVQGMYPFAGCGMAESLQRITSHDFFTNTDAGRDYAGQLEAAGDAALEASIKLSDYCTAALESDCPEPAKAALRVVVQTADDQGELETMLTFAALAVSKGCAAPLVQAGLTDVKAAAGACLDLMLAVAEGPTDKGVPSEVRHALYDAATLGHLQSQMFFARTTPSQAADFKFTVSNAAGGVATAGKRGAELYCELKAACNAPRLLDLTGVAEALEKCQVHDNAEIAVLKARVAELEAQLAAALTKAELAGEADAKLQELQGQLDEARATVDSAEARIEEVRAAAGVEADQLREEKARLEDACSVLEAQIQAMEGTIRGRDGELAELTRQMGDARTDHAITIAEKNAAIDELHKQIAGLADRMEESNAAYEMRSTKDREAMQRVLDHPKLDPDIRPPLAESVNENMTDAVRRTLQTIVDTGVLPDHLREAVVNLLREGGDLSDHCEAVAAVAGVAGVSIPATVSQCVQATEDADVHGGGLGAAASATAELAEKIRRGESIHSDAVRAMVEELRALDPTAGALADDAIHRQTSGDANGAASALHDAAAAAARASTQGVAVQPRLAGLLSDLEELHRRLAGGVTVTRHEITSLRNRAMEAAALGASAAEACVAFLAKAASKHEVSDDDRAALVILARDAMDRHPDVADPLRGYAESVVADPATAGGSAADEAEHHEDVRLLAAQCGELARRLQLGECGREINTAAAKLAAAFQQAKAHSARPSESLTAAAAGMQRAAQMIQAGGPAALHEVVRAAQDAETASGCGLRPVVNATRNLAGYAKSLASRVALQQLPRRALDLTLDCLIAEMHRSAHAVATRSVVSVALGDAAAMLRHRSDAQASESPSVLLDKISELLLHACDAQDGLARCVEQIGQASASLEQCSGVGGGQADQDICSDALVALTTAASTASAAAASAQDAGLEMLGDALDSAAGHIREICGRCDDAIANPAQKPPTKAELLVVNTHLTPAVGALGGDEAAARLISERLRHLLASLAEDADPMKSCEVLEQFPPPEAVAAAQATTAYDMGPSAGESTALRIANTLRRLQTDVETLRDGGGDGGADVDAEAAAEALQRQLKETLIDMINEANRVQDTTHLVGRVMPTVERLLNEIAAMELEDASLLPAMVEGRELCEGVAEASQRARTVARALWGMESCASYGMDVAKNDLAKLAEEARGGAERVPAGGSEAVQPLVDVADTMEVMVAAKESVAPSEYGRLFDLAATAAGLSTRGPAGAAMTLSNKTHALLRRLSSGGDILPQELLRCAAEAKAAAARHPGTAPTFQLISDELSQCAGDANVGADGGTALRGVADRTSRLYQSLQGRSLADHGAQWPDAEGLLSEEDEVKNMRNALSKQMKEEMEKQTKKWKQKLKDAEAKHGEVQAELGAVAELLAEAEMDRDTAVERCTELEVQLEELQAEAMEGVVDVVKDRDEEIRLQAAVIDESERRRAEQSEAVNRVEIEALEQTALARIAVVFANQGTDAWILTEQALTIRQQTWESEEARYKRALQEAEEACAGLEGAVVRREEEARRLQQEIDDVAKAVEVTNAKHESEINGLTLQLRLKTEEVEALDAAINEHEGIGEMRAAQEGNLKHELSKQQDLLGGIQKELTDAKQASTALEQELAKVTGEKQSLEEIVAELTEKLKTIDGDDAARGKELEGKMAAVEEVRKELETATAQLADAAAARAQQADTITAMESEIAALKDEVAAAAAGSGGGAGDAGRVAALEVELSAAIAAREEQQASFTVMENEAADALEAAETQRLQLEKELKEAHEVIAELTEALEA